WVSGTPLRCEDFLEAIVPIQLPLTARRLFDQALNDGIGIHPFGNGREVEEDSVAKYGIGKRLDVLALHVGPVIEQGPRLGSENQVLDSTRAGSPAQPVLDKTGYSWLADPGLTHERQCILKDVFGNRHAANQSL